MLPRCSNCAIRPTSSMMPVNIGVLVRIVEIAFYGKVLTKTVQCDVANISSFADLLKSGAGCEWHRACASQDLRRIIKEYLIHRIGGQGSPVQQSTTFNYDARDLEFAKAREDTREIRASVRCAKTDLLDADTPVLQLAALLFLCERTEDEKVIFHGFDQAGFQGKPQARVHDNPQQGTAARQPRAVGQKRIVGNYCPHADHNGI